jgi:hypothetical protein
MTATIARPVRARRTPALTPNVLSMVSSSTRHSAEPYRERQCRGDHAAGTVAAHKDDDGEPDKQRAEEGPRPWLGNQRTHDYRGLHFSFWPTIARAASTMIRMVPLAPTCPSDSASSADHSGSATAAAAILVGGGQPERDAPCGPPSHETVHASSSLYPAPVRVPGLRV